MLDLFPSLGSYWPAVPVALRVQAWPWVMEILWLEQLPRKLETPWAAVSGLRPLQPCPRLGAWAQGKQGLFVLEADPVASKQTLFASLPLPDLDVRAALHWFPSPGGRRPRTVGLPRRFELTGYVAWSHAKL